MSNLLFCAFVTGGIAYAVRLLFSATPFAHIGIDDANIFFVYGRNFRLGAGFVYNIGGEHVEGFTSLLWVLFCAVAFFFRNPERVLLIFNILLIASVISFLSIRLNKTYGRIISLSALATLAWTFTAPEYLSWTVLTLMETGLWSSLLIATVLSLSGAAAGSRALRLLFPVFLALMLITRPEAIAWGFGFTGLLFIYSYVQDGRLITAIRHALPALTSYLITLATLTLFRLTYFGYPLPNTYYAKVSPDKAYSHQEGIDYFRAFLETNGWIPYLLGAAIVVAATLTILGLIRIIQRRFDALPASHILAYSASVTCIVGMIIPILVGGDHFASFRFYQPIWPLLPIPLFYIIHWIGLLTERLLGRKTPKKVFFGLKTALKLAILLILVKSFTRSNHADWNSIEKTQLYINFANANDGRTFGTNMSALFADTQAPSLGAITAGGFKFAYDGDVIDLMGLNNVAMGHSAGERKGIKNHAAFSKEVFFQLQPQVMPLTETVPAEIGENITWEHPQVQRCVQHRWSRIPLKDLYFEPEFHENYTLAYITRADQSTPLGLLAFLQNDYLQTISTNEVLSILKNTQPIHF